MDIEDRTIYWWDDKDIVEAHVLMKGKWYAKAFDKTSALIEEQIERRTKNLLEACESTVHCIDVTGKEPGTMSKEELLKLPASPHPYLQRIQLQGEDIDAFYNRKTFRHPTFND